MGSYVCSACHKPTRGVYEPEYVCKMCRQAVKTTQEAPFQSTKSISTPVDGPQAIPESDCAFCQQKRGNNMKFTEPPEVQALQLVVKPAVPISRAKLLEGRAKGRLNHG